MAHARQDTRSLSDADNDVKKLGPCVRAIGHTVLLMQPWNDPMPLKRAYCIKEVYHTQACTTDLHESTARPNVYTTLPCLAAFFAR